MAQRVLPLQEEVRRHWTAGKGLMVAKLTPPTEPPLRLEPRTPSMEPVNSLKRKPLQALQPEPAEAGLPSRHYCLHPQG